MKSSERLEYIEQFNKEEFQELWDDCFAGAENTQHMFQFVNFNSMPKESLYCFLTSNHNKFKTWLIKRKEDNKIIGVLLHGDFLPDKINNIVISIGLKFTRKGYAKEAVGTLINHLREDGHSVAIACYNGEDEAILNTLKSLGFKDNGFTNSKWPSNKEKEYTIELRKNKFS